MTLKKSFQYIFFLAVFTSVICASAQTASNTKRTNFEFASRELAADILGANDEYVAVTADLERQAKTRTNKPVDRLAFVQYMRLTTKEWTASERAKVERELPALEKFINQIVWDKPEKIQFIRASGALEDNLPHTRGNAIVLPDSAFAMPRGAFVSMLAHEAFHVLSRKNTQLRESSYKLIGFERCESISIHPKIEQLKITNPDTPLSQHSIAVTYKGKNVDALPFIGFESIEADTSTGFIDKLSVNWLIVKRSNNQCLLDSDNLTDNSAAPESFSGLFEKIGENTAYLFHAEEILAENFAALYMASLGGKQIQTYPSVQLLINLKKMLFAPAKE